MCDFDQSVRYNLCFFGSCENWLLALTFNLFPPKLVISEIEGQVLSVLSFPFNNSVLLQSFWVQPLMLFLHCSKIVGARHCVSTVVVLRVTN